jgi:uncharacterized protein YbjT (DUF2867 family)
MTILVTGATGAVGRHVVAGLLGADRPVRALTRGDGAGLPAAAHAVTADLADPASLTPEVFDGVEAVVVFPAASGVGDLMDAAVKAGVERFVVLSSLAAALEHPRDHGSASAVHHLAVERDVAARTDGWAVVRPGTFANNLLAWAHAVRAGQPIRAPYLASAQAPVHEADVADALVAALAGFPVHRGSAVAVTGPRSLTRREQIAAIGRAVGREVAAVEISPEEFRRETAAFIPEDITAMLLGYWRDTVTEPDRVRSVESLSGHPGRTLDQWAQDHRAEFGVAAG